MKKYITILLVFLVWQKVEVNAQAHSRPNGAYYNLEKYWYYRFRLVNDFMKIGTQCGESLPASARFGRYWGEDHYRLEWGNGPLHLGTYISSLATEHRLLANNFLSTTRTDFELDLALKAFERIDANAETYCYDIAGTYPCKNQENEWKNKLNGFFIRDDVPYTFFQDVNLSHFNRHGPNGAPYNKTKLRASAITGRLPSCAMDRHEKVATWSHPIDRCLPTEESGDQTTNIAMGLALTSNLLGLSSTLGANAGNSLKRMIEFIADCPTPYWSIINPVTEKCVYGDVEGNNCSDGGAIFMHSSYGAARTSENWAPHTPGLITDATPYKSLWNLQQYDVIHEDFNFWGTFGALADNWYLSLYIGPYPVGIKNSTWTRMKQFALHFHEANPHYPYLYRVLHHKGNPFMFEQTRIKLDEAPPCGPHNYLGNYSNRISWETGAFVNNGPYAWHWSGSDLLHSYYDRDGWVRKSISLGHGDRSGSPYDRYADFNGLDYMALFNLYSLQDFYHLWMFNSYYKENFNMNFPDKVGTPQETGSLHRQLKLNFLEYVSAINKVNSNGYFTMRCAKVIDLLPGFEAKSGSNFTAYIDDYLIDCGNTETHRPSEEYHYAEITQKPGWVYQPLGILPQSQNDTIYFLDFPPDGVPYLPDSSAYSTLDSNYLDTITCEMAMANFDSLVAEIYSTGDSIQIAHIDSLIPYITFPECDSTGGGVPPPSLRKIFGSDTTSGNGAIYDFNIFPNPSNGHFTFAFAEVGEYDIKIYNSLGSVVFQTYVYSRRSEIVHIDGLPNGVYTAEVVNSKGAPNKRIRKIVISR